MRPKVTVVDYGLGNLFSVSRALEYCGAEVELSDSIPAVAHADRLILPGVGAFANGMDGLKQRGLVEPILEFVKSGKPFMGICLGMQMMLSCSEEHGYHEGLGIIPGRVSPIPATGTDGRPHKIPHIGWSEIVRPAHVASWDGTLLAGIETNPYAYFVHSFTAMPEDPAHRLADCHYDRRTISAVIKAGAAYGCQFHPERSGPIGLKIIANFLNL